MSDQKASFKVKFRNAACSQNGFKKRKRKLVFLSWVVCGEVCDVLVDESEEVSRVYVT